LTNIYRANDIPENESMRTTVC